ncbi:beta-galactosidase [Bryocella elongata]|uniref:Beta-galactosidase n=1 Tax=Bryocella elongata TaxID=863522 RepID=A0A1H5XWZ2_9BACT|nr:glycoside hydrolase family 2 TIM barrel-domain containing protein [Bryocella elongata]SEG16309.1 beta-galactosidase [Bryocella elongata]
MERRQFLKATGAAAAVSITEGLSFALPPAPEHVRSLPMNRGWRYKAEDVAGAERVAFNDAGFTEIVIPHTNVSLPWHNFDDKSYEFVSTYRRSFRPPTWAKGKRIFVDFEGAMTASTVFLNGEKLGEYRGGFTPFSFELTKLVRHDGPNVLTVKLDSTERKDIPPFGYEIDYLTFGGIYREVALRIVPQLFLDNVHARTLNVLTQPALEVDCFLSAPAKPADGKLALLVELLDGDRVIASRPHDVEPSRSSESFTPWMASIGQGSQTINDPAKYTVRLDDLKDIALWDIHFPKLYEVRVTFVHEGTPADQQTRRVGFREAAFTPQGFQINGKVVKLRGLDRHQTFPFAGQAMPARVQRKDADILRHELHCNIVRTSHYPQSRHFLDRCDEVGLLVLEEIPGWQHIGDEAWQDVAVDNVRRMITRDWNHPSIVLWGVRINESRDNDAFYTRTNALAHSLDTTRQTGGIRNFAASHLIEDVFTINDFGFPLREPNHPLYLNTEFVGHTFPTKTTDDDERQREHTLRHARIHNQLASDARYAGGIGWCAFDYNTHANFGSGDRICYHGVTDIFRLPKAAAGFYKSQCDPTEEVVLEPAFQWANGDESVGFTTALVCSNCEKLRFSIRPMFGPEDGWHQIAEIEPDHESFPHLKYAPFQIDKRGMRLDQFGFPWGDLRIEGLIAGKVVITKTLSGAGVDRDFHLTADDTTLNADGADSTRLVLRATDEFGTVRRYANDPILISIEGPATLIGDTPFALIGGQGAVWIRATQQPGTITVRAKHPRLGTKTLTLRVEASPRELV